MKQMENDALLKAIAVSAFLTQGGIPSEDDKKKEGHAVHRSWVTPEVERKLNQVDIQNQRIRGILIIPQEFDLTKTTVEKVAQWLAYAAKYATQITMTLLNSTQDLKNQILRDPNFHMGKITWGPMPVRDAHWSLVAPEVQGILDRVNVHTQRAREILSKSQVFDLTKTTVEKVGQWLAYAAKYTTPITMILLNSTQDLKNQILKDPNFHMGQITWGPVPVRDAHWSLVSPEIERKLNQVDTQNQAIKQKLQEPRLYDLSQMTVKDVSNFLSYAKKYSVPLTLTLRNVSEVELNQILDDPNADMIDHIDWVVPERKERIRIKPNPIGGRVRDKLAQDPLPTSDGQKLLDIKNKVQRKSVQVSFKDPVSPLGIWLEQKPIEARVRDKAAHESLPTSNAFRPLDIKDKEEKKSVQVLFIDPVSPLGVWLEPKPVEGNVRDKKPLENDDELQGVDRESLEDMAQKNFEASDLPVIEEMLAAVPIDEEDLESLINDRQEAFGLDDEDQSSELRQIVARGRQSPQLEELLENIGEREEFISSQEPESAESTRQALPLEIEIPASVIIKEALFVENKPKLIDGVNNKHTNAQAIAQASDRLVDIFCRGILRSR